jgi:drug/metabolite transporter (DMT)-like permease
LHKLESPSADCEAPAARGGFVTPATDPPGARRHRHGLMHLLMLVATVFWAANIVAGKLALRDLSAPALAQFRVTAAGIIFLLTFVFWPRRQRLKLGRREWFYLAVTALFGITLNQIFFIGGIGKTSAAHAGLIVALGPVMVLLLSCGLRLEALTALKGVGAAVAFAGVAVLSAGHSRAGSGATLAGDMTLLVGTAVFAYYTILLKKIADRYDTLTLNAVIFCFGAAFMIPYSFRAAARVPWRSLSAEDWQAMAFIVVCGSVLAYLIYAFALTELTATRVAAFAYLQPVIAAALGVWLLGESLTARVVGGGAAILLGVYLTEREGRQKVSLDVAGA